MNLLVFLFCLFGLQGACLWVSARASRGVKGKDDYFLAGKKVSFFPLMMTFLATQVGGGAILGSAEEAYRFGWWAACYPLGIGLGLVILGRGAGRRLASAGVSTIAQLFETVYGSIRLKKIASLCSIASLFMIFVAQIIASRKFILSLGVDYPLLFILFWGIVIFYTVMGGLKAVIAADGVQAAFFVCVFLGSFFYLFIADKIPLFAGATFEIGGFSRASGWLLMPLLFMLIEQDMAQRCFAGESPQAISRATFVAGIGTLAIGIVPVVLGIAARSMDLSFQAGSSVLMAVIQHGSNPVVSALVGSAILFAIISTADSLLNAISSNISQDFSFKGNPIRIAQIATGAIAVVGLLFSYFFTSVVDTLIQSYELSLSALFAPIMWALFKKKGNALSATLSMVSGGSAALLLRLYPLPFPREILSIVFSFAAYGVAEWAIARRVVRA